MFVVHDNNPVQGQLSQCQRTQYSHIFGDIFLKHIEIIQVPSTADLIQNICYYIPNHEKEVEEGNNYE